MFKYKPKECPQVGISVGRQACGEQISKCTNLGVKSILQCLARHTLVAVVHTLAEAFATGSQLVPLCSG